MTIPIPQNPRQAQCPECGFWGWISNLAPDPTVIPWTCPHCGKTTSKTWLERSQNP